jgi:inner membrane transporter RhtA
MFPGVLSQQPPTYFFLVSAVFHYLGPSLAVLLFARLTRSQRWTLLALGVVLAFMNAVFYLAVDQLPLATVSSIEFLGTIIVAAAGTRTKRNLAALIVTIGGVAVLTEVRLTGQPAGYAFAFANCAGFMLYVILAHRIATTATAGLAGDGGASPLVGVDEFGAAMLIAAVVTFALMLALLPAVATIIGLLVLHQIPTGQDLAGIGLVIAGIAVHHSGPIACPHPSSIAASMSSADAKPDSSIRIAASK